MICIHIQFGMCSSAGLNGKEKEACEIVVLCRSVCLHILHFSYATTCLISIEHGKNTLSSKTSGTP
jgi:hypothetical protein